MLNNIPHNYKSHYKKGTYTRVNANVNANIRKNWGKGLEIEIKLNRIFWFLILVNKFVLTYRIIIVENVWYVNSRKNYLDKSSRLISYTIIIYAVHNSTYVEFSRPD